MQRPNQTKNEDSSSTTNEHSELKNSNINNDIKSLLYIGNSIIPEVDEVKFLGITFDGRLSWDRACLSWDKHVYLGIGDVYLGIGMFILG